MMELVGTFRGRDNVYSRKGYDGRGKITTFYYHRGPDGRWESLDQDKGWEGLNAHVSKRLDEERLKEG